MNLKTDKSKTNVRSDRIRTLPAADKKATPPATQTLNAVPQKIEAPVFVSPGR